VSTTLATMVAPLLADYIYIGGGVGLIIIIILVILVLRRGR
jgi:hypothetical protein